MKFYGQHSLLVPHSHNTPIHCIAEEENFHKFQVFLNFSQKVYLRNLGAWGLLVEPASNPRKFSPSKVSSSCYTVNPPASQATVTCAPISQFTKQSPPTAISILQVMKGGGESPRMGLTLPCFSSSFSYVVKNLRCSCSQPLHCPYRF